MVLPGGSRHDLNVVVQLWSRKKAVVCETLTAASLGQPPYSLIGRISYGIGFAHTWRPQPPSIGR